MVYQYLLEEIYIFKKMKLNLNTVKFVYSKLNQNRELNIIK